MNELNKTNFYFGALSGKIFGCAMQVNTFLGNGFREVIYQEALEIELKQAA